MVVQKPREIAFEILQQRAQGHGFTESLVDAALERAAGKREDRALVQEIVCGVVRWERTLDWLVARKSGRRPQKPAVAILLRMALYQMFWLERVPGYAAVNESVALAKARGLIGQAAFINAVLRGCGREEAAIRQQMRELREINPSLGYSHPEWLVQRWLERWGQERTRRLLDWNNQPPATYARVNALRSTGAALAERWRHEGVEFEQVPIPWAPQAEVYRLLKLPPLSGLESFRQGGWYVQDPSTLLAPEMLAPKPGDRILDLCAAPGGKATYLAQLIHNEGCIVAEDADADRLRLVTENAARLGAACVTTTLPSVPSGPEFNCVLVDAPCSNTGVLRRRVDLRWRIQPAEITRLAGEQRSILRRAAERTKVGGTLLYSTCSLEPEENQAIMQEFLKNQPGFVLETEQQLTPWDEQVDGAYCAKLIRQR